MYGQHYWKDLSNEELEEYWPRCCVKVDNVHTPEELNAFIAAKMDEGIDLYDEVLPYKCFMIPDFDGKYGYMLFCATHALVDGIQILPTFLTMSNDGDMSSLRRVATPTLAQRTLAQIFAPIGAIRVAIQLLVYPFEKNCLKSPPGQDRSRVIRISNDILVQDLKKSSKLYKCSITEACHTVVSQTLKEYARRRGHDDLKEITITQTFSTKSMP